MNPHKDRRVDRKEIKKKSAIISRKKESKIMQMAPVRLMVPSSGQLQLFWSLCLLESRKMLHTCREKLWAQRIMPQIPFGRYPGLEPSSWDG